MTIPVDVFQQLRDTAPVSPGKAYRSFGGPEGLTITAFVDGMSRIPGLGITIASSQVPGEFVLPKMRGAEIHRQVTGSSQDNPTTYEITAAGREYVEVFVELAGRLIEDALTSSTPREALLLIAKRLAAWAKFFDGRNAGKFSRSQELGIVGELLCLQRLGKMIGYSTATMAWMGPSGGPHDFVGRSGAVEVKLTTSASPERFRITSARQLDEEPIRLLLLCAIMAQEAPGGPVTLPRLAAEIRSALEESAPAAGIEFENRLLEAGYAPAADNPEPISLVIHRLEFLKVHGEFPRVRPSELRLGVDELSYSLPWSAIAPYRVLPDTAKEVFNG